ncbi:uncharacterized protein LOC123563783 [Mercenaria mercenaria]|uniref:uncharacterized protein LOC123563783 n=1 Tax=Mercenaria mercenaria TaxID=6596 RepID=UPI00234EC282|nr:uncharacterized protein LOC123563783 [Mercenaria mercenaria]
MGNGFLRKLTTTLSVIACLLQIASVASPGWIIYIKGNIEEHHGLFYKRTCKTIVDDTKCKVESFHELHHDLRDRLVNAKVSREKIASVDFAYNSLICKQVLTMVAVCLGLGMAVSQVVQSIKKHKGFQRLIFLSAATAATSAGMVIVVACNDIVTIYYQIELQSFDDDRDHTYVGFPFCLGMLLGSAFLHFWSLVAIFPQLHTPRVKVKVRKALPRDDEPNGVPSTYVPPVTTLNEVSVPKPAKSKMVGNDNLVFSEKL